MLNLNKLALNEFPWPFALTMLQMLSTLVIVPLIVLAKPGGFRVNRSQLAHLASAGLIWATPLVFNLQALKYLNPETCIVFRSACLVGVALGDYTLFHRRFSLVETLSLVSVVGGAWIFALSNVKHNFAGYAWGTAYWASLTASLLYVKRAFNHCEGIDTWEKTLYLNMFGLFPTVLLVIGFELNFVSSLQGFPVMSWIWIVCSSAMGILLGVFGNSARAFLSPTGFDVLGNVSKFATVAVSALIFQETHTFLSYVGLGLVIFGGAIFGVKDAKKWVLRFGILALGLLAFKTLVPLLIQEDTRAIVDNLKNSTQYGMQPRDHRTHPFPTFDELAVEWLGRQREFKRFIVVHPIGGLGNVFHALTGTLILSILTERSLVIVWSGCESGLFGLPLSSLCLHNVVKENKHFARRYDAFLRADRKSSLAATICLNARCYLAKQYLINGRRNDEMLFGHFPELSSLPFNERWPQDIAVIKTEIYFAGFLFMNPSYTALLSSLFQGAEVYPTVLRFLFRPAPHVLRHADEFANEHLRGQCISVFVRTTGFKGELNEESVALFHSREEAMQLLGPQHHRCIQREIARLVSHNATVFVASIYKQAKTLFREHYANVAMIDMDVGSQDGHGGGGRTNEFYAVLDLLLLARCRYAVHSYSSTFGQLARALSVQPQILYQTPSPTLADFVTPIIDGVGQTLYRVNGTCRRVLTREACSAIWSRWRSRNRTSSFYERVHSLTPRTSRFPVSFDHRHHC